MKGFIGLLISIALYYLVLRSNKKAVCGDQNNPDLY